jgi:hypothetical protein
MLRLAFYWRIHICAFGLCSLSGFVSSLVYT